MVTLWDLLAPFWVDNAEFIGFKCQCNGDTCDGLALWSVPWPGRSRINQCDPHKRWTQEIANALGFELEGITPIAVVDRRPEPDPSAARFAAMELD